MRLLHRSMGTTAAASQGIFSPKRKMWRNASTTRGSGPGMPFHPTGRRSSPSSWERSRELAIDRYRAQRTQKRGGGVYDVALEELEECLWTERDTVERAVEGNLLGEAISRFLWEQPPLHRDVFVLRYYHFSSIQRIAKAYAIGESKTKSILFRTRKKLRVFLESEGLL